MAQKLNQQFLYAMQHAFVVGYLGHKKTRLDIGKIMGSCALFETSVSKLMHHIFRVFLSEFVLADEF